MNMAYGASDAFDALVYGQAHPSTTQFLQNQLSTVSNYFTEAGRSFMEKTHQIFDHYNSSAAMEFARSAVRTVAGIFDVRTIRQLSTLSDFTQANDIMQRYLMASPILTVMYLRQRIDGYSDTYVNMNGSTVGAANYDYRRVNNGILQWEGEEDWKITQYHELLRDGDRDLIFSEQLDILNSQRAMEMIIALGRDDPTSSTGGQL